VALEELLKQWQGEDPYDGSERRASPRLVWPSSNRPTLTIKEHELEVINISEGGLKYSDFLERRFGEKVYGTLDLLSGQSIDITGEIAWQAEDEFGLRTIHIPRSVIIEETHALLRRRDSSESAQTIDGQAMLICPHCNYKQNQTAECVRCGIIIDKYRDKKPLPSPEQTETRPAKSASADVSLAEDVSEKTITDYSWLLQKIIPDKLEYLFRNIFTRRNPFYKYLANFLDVMIQAGLLVLATTIICIVFMYMCKMTWSVYIATAVGKKFLNMFPVKAQNIVDILSRELIFFAIQLTFKAFIICLVISALCQVFHIARYLYLPRGFVMKIILWGLPLTAIVAIHIQDAFGLQQPGLAYVVALVPTLCIFSGCFKFTYELLPEIGTLIAKTIQIATQAIQTRFPK